MKSLSQSEYGELRSLYQQVYTSTDEITVDDLSEEVVEEIFDELVQEYVSEGYEVEEVLDVVEEAALDFIEAKVTYGHDTEAPKAPEKKSMLKGRIRYAKRKAGEAVKAGKEKVKTAKAGAEIAGLIAKDEVRRAGRAGKQAVVGAVQKKKEQVKKGVRGLIGRGLRKAAGAVGKVASKASTAAARLGEEAIQEADSIAAMRERAAKRRKQRYGASDTSRGGRDDFRPYTKADYERGEANDPRKKDQKEEFEIDEARAMGSARSGDQNPKGSQVRVSSGRGMTMTPARGLGASKPKGDDAKRKAKYDAQAKADRRAAARDRAAEGEDRVGRLIRKVQREELEATGLFSKKELDGMFEQMTTQTQIPPVGDSLKPGNPNAAPKPVKLPPPTAKKKPEPKLGAGTPGFGYGVGTGP